MFKIIMQGIFLIVRLIISENPSEEIPVYEKLMKAYAAFVAREEGKDAT